MPEIRYSPVRVLLAVIVAAGGIWLVATVTGAEFFAKSSPTLALRLNSYNPTALLASARRVIDTERGVIPAPLPKSESESDAAEEGGEATESEPDSAETSRVVALQELAIEAAKTAPKALTASSGPPALSASTRETVQALAKKVLAHDPLNARAMRLLGEVASASGDDGKAEALMKAAAHLSLRESAALGWLLDKSFERKDYKAALGYADALMRTRPQIRNPVTARLTAAAETPAGNGPVKELLATNPPWRAAFFQMTPSHITDARTPLDLLLALKDTPVPPDTGDIKSYLDFLVGRKLYDIAYYAWLQFLNPEQLNAAGFVINGAFETQPSGLPFDWTIKPGNGVIVAVEPLPQDPTGHALSVIFSQGRANFVPVVQLTMLTPGDYTFATRIKGQMSGRRGLLWRIACVEKPNNALAQSSNSLGKNPEWAAQEFNFTIPAQGCQAQYLKLELDARSASEQLVSGAVWYDDVAIKRKVGAASNAATP